MIRVIFVLLRNPWFWLGLTVLLVGIYYFNRLVKARLRLQEALSSLDNQLHRRRTLIPQIREEAQGLQQGELYLERMLSELSIPEAALSGEKDLVDRAGKEEKLSRQLHAILSELEKNQSLGKKPDNLESKLQEVENELQLAARYYNAVVREYNYQLESFPSGIIAAFLNFDRAEFFLLEEAE